MSRFPIRPPAPIRRDLGRGPLDEVDLLLPAACRVDAALLEEALDRCGVASLSPRSCRKKGRGRFVLPAVDGGRVVVRTGGKPLPREELLHLVSTDPLWPLVLPALEEHRSVLRLRTLSVPGLPVPRRGGVARAAAHLAERLGAIAVFWPKAYHLVPTPLYLGILQAAGSLRPPTRALIRVTVAGGDGDASALTWGLEQLGHSNIEVTGSFEQLDVLVRTAYSLADYVLTTGVSLQEGDGIEIPGHPAATVRRVASPVWIDEEIVRVDLPEAVVVRPGFRGREQAC